MKVIVIGAGALGAGVTRALAVAGEEVHLLDQRGPAAGTTGTTFAWTNANRKFDPAYHRLNVAGMEEHAKLARDLPGPPSYFPSGALQWADAAHEQWLADTLGQLESLDYPARWVTRSEAARIAGDIRIPQTVAAIAHFPSEGYVLPERLVANLLADAQRYGATAAIGEVATVDETPHGVAVTLAGGEILTADRVVLATGRWTEDLAATAGITLPMVTGTGRGAPTVGLLGYVRSPELGLRCVLHTPSLNLRPGADDHTAVVQALDLNDGVDPDVPPQADGRIAATIRQRLTALMPESSRTPEIDLRVGFRSLPADGLTVAGYASAGSRVYCLVSHSAITMTAVLARLAAAEISTGDEQDLLNTFRPTRFAGRSRSDVEVDQRPRRLGEQ
jgi:glycine/D-amino acid oxidase-like deaminating enzyme